MDEYQVRHSETLSAHEQRIAQLERRMGCVEQMQTNLADLVTGVAVLAEQYKTIAADTGQIKTRLDLIEDRPTRRWDGLVQAIIAALVGLAVGYFFVR